MRPKKRAPPVPPKRAAPPLSSSAAVQPHKKQKGKPTRMDEWSGLVTPEPENQQPAAGISDSKSDNSSLTSALNSIEVPIFDEHQDEVASNSGTVEVLLTNDIQKEPGVLVHSSAQPRNQHTTHSLDLSKFPGWVYSEPTGRSRNEWIWGRGHDIQRVGGRRSNGKMKRQWVCKLCKPIF